LSILELSLSFDNAAESGGRKKKCAQASQLHRAVLQKEWLDELGVMRAARSRRSLYIGMYNDDHGSFTQHAFARKI
jgi:hypothetical protein